MTGIPYPDIDPIALQLGPLAIRWYALAYLAGIIIGWRYAMAMARRTAAPVSPRDYDDFMIWAVAGVILGGRLGQVLFYHPDYYLTRPLEIFMIWKGGMAFHGGLLGVIVAMVIFARRRNLPLLPFTDLIALVAPIGICFGRIANFINQEHWGRPTESGWGVIFPMDPTGLPRHASQLYEAALEGLVLYLLLAALVHLGGGLRRPGLTTGVFLAGYAVARMVAEFFREPEILVGVLPFATTWGQWLSLPMLAIGVYIIIRAFRVPVLPSAPAKGMAGKS